MNELLQELQERGLIFQSTNLDDLSKEMDNKSISLYCGFDPTADSLHIGHLLPIITLKRFQEFNHQSIALVGGATGMIGDPSFKAQERTLNSAETVQHYTECIKNQLMSLLNQNVIIENNLNWFKDMNCLDFLRDIGKLFSVNAMLNKDSVKQRLDKQNGNGLSFTEFSYALLQGYDFAKLNEKHNVTLQIGGSDQWGNMVGGLDTTKRLNNKEDLSLHLITLPLLVKSDGTKFGKSENGETIWLDPKKTSPYTFYQFWLKTEDKDVYKFLKYFTFLSIDEINQIEEDDKLNNGTPKAQSILAREMTTMIHGADICHQVEQISQILFKGQLNKNNWTPEMLQSLAETLKETDNYAEVSINENAIDLVDLLVLVKLAQSKRQARELIQSNAITIYANSENTTVFNKSDFIFEKYVLLKRGKRNFGIALLK